jgi:hypothetical protein
MRAHVIEDNIVVNTIEVDSLDFMPGLIDGSVGGIGWVWDGKNLTDPNAPSEADIIAMQWDTIRAERDAKLAASDWTQIADAPVDDLVWATYRQGLRDVPNTQTDPFNIVWPTAPA